MTLQLRTMQQYILAAESRFDLGRQPSFLDVLLSQNTKYLLLKVYNLLFPVVRLRYLTAKCILKYANKLLSETVVILYLIKLVLYRDGEIKIYTVSKSSLSDISQL
jgi:hypothetical protein